MASPPPPPPRCKSGCIIRKRRFHQMVSLAIKPEKGANVDDNDDNENENEQPPTLVMVPRDNPCLAWCALGAWIRVEVEETKDENAKSASAAANNNHTLAVQIELLQCSPDPNAIATCLPLVANGTLPLSVFSTKSHLQHLHQIEEILRTAPRDKSRRETILRVSRELQGMVDHANGKPGTSRLTHVKKWQWKILEKMEETIPLVKVYSSSNTVENNETTTTRTGIQEDVNDNGNSRIVITETNGTLINNTTTKVMNVPDVNSMSIRHGISRVDYLKDKKWPQIQWILRRLQPLLLQGHDNDERQQQQPKRVLDVGGGRGDLAVAIVQAFPHVHVTVVDQNESSLLAGKDYARQLGLLHHRGKEAAAEEEEEDRITFHCSDFATYVQEYDDDAKSNSKRHNLDVVVAWHACGDLSDCALQFALKQNASFVICPCCYTKRYISSFEPLWIGGYVQQQLSNAYNNNNETSNDNPSREGTATATTNRSEDANNVPQSNSPQKKSREEEITILQKLAETNDQPEVSQRAMRVINSMRLHALQQEQDRIITTVIDSRSKNDSKPSSVTMRLEQYESSYSPKNLVLVGEQRLLQAVNGG